MLRGLTKWSLTRAIIMDHLDWFAPGSEHVDQEIEELHRVLVVGGFVLWRSAARKPWYNEAYVSLVFRSCESMVDRIYMYQI